MKYFDNEYYDMMSKLVLKSFNIDDRANNYTETYYEELYEECIEAFLNQKNYEDAKKDFKKLLLLNITELKCQLPKHIMDSIKDIRVAALGVVSQEIYNEIIINNNAIERYFNNRYEKYKENYLEVRKVISKNCLEALDCFIEDGSLIKYEIINADVILYLSLDSYTKKGGYDLRLIFKNGKFNEIVGNFNDEYIRTFEVYYINGQIEYHMKLIYSQCIIISDDIYHEYSEDYKVREGL